MSAPGERLITDRAHTSLSQIHEQSVREALAQEGTQESWDKQVLSIGLNYLVQS